jgi:genome maintenance exonuclease 1
MTHLNEWRKRVGEDKARQITTEAAGVGTAMHANLERFLAGLERMPGNNPVHVKANAMADRIIAEGLSKVNEVWAMEQSLYYPGLYSGTTDLVGVYDGEPAVMDHKQTNKPKKAEWVEDYFMQLTAYILAHNEVYNTNIRRGVVFMCSRGDDPVKIGGEIYQQFDLLPKDFNKYEDMWLTKVEDYYKNYAN